MSYILWCYEKLFIAPHFHYDNLIEHNIVRDHEDIKFLSRAVSLGLQILKQRYFKELHLLLGIPERLGFNIKTSD